MRFHHSCASLKPLTLCLHIGGNFRVFISLNSTVVSDICFSTKFDHNLYVRLSAGTPGHVLDPDRFVILDYVWRCGCLLNPILLYFLAFVAFPLGTWLKTVCILPLPPFSPSLLCGLNHRKSLTNGWALICVCLHYFPPNSKFRDALLAYLNARADASVSLVFSSTQSLKKAPSSLETATAIASGLAPIVSELKPVSNGHGANYNQGSNTTRASTTGSVRSDALLVSESSDLIDSELSPSVTSSACGRRMNTTQSNGSRQFEFTVGLWDRPTAAHFARVAPRWFIRALNVGPRKLQEAPSIEEICHVKVSSSLCTLTIHLCICVIV